jgi:hypothetical protein
MTPYHAARWTDSSQLVEPPVPRGHKQHQLYNNNVAAIIGPTPTLPPREHSRLCSECTRLILLYTNIIHVQNRVNLI